MANCTLTLERRRHNALGLRLLGRAGSIVVRAADTLYLWLERARERDRLAGLDAHLLKDIGVGRSEVERESASRSGGSEPSEHGRYRLSFS